MIVNIQWALGYDSKILDPIKSALIHVVGVLFVDDTDLYTWDVSLKTGHDIWKQHQKELDQWTLLLNTMGGALSPSKCFCYLIDYECTDRE